MADGPDEIEIEAGDPRQLLPGIGQRRVGHQHGGKEREPDAALDQRRGPAAVYLAHVRPDKPKTQQREQADGDDAATTAR